MNIVLPLIVILLMVALNALYVAAEFATVGARRSRIQESADKGNGTAKRLLTILSDGKRLDNYVAACQIGITLTSLVAGAYGQAVLSPLLEPTLGAIGGRATAIIIVLIAITATQVILGELLPKTISLRYPEKVSLLTLLPMQLNLWLFKPLIFIFNGSAFGLMKIAGLGGDHSHSHVHSPEELAGLYRDSAEGGLIDVAEREMLAGVLNVNRRLVKEIMTPRRRLTMISGELSLEEALFELANKPHSRFPVQGEGDDIIGMISLREIYVHSRNSPDLKIKDVARPAIVVPEMATVPNLWLQLREQDRNCGLIVNEFGSIVGMTTIEDAIEEIFGEVFDEFDIEEEPIQVKNEKVILRGDVLLETLRDRFSLEFQSEAVDTIGGYIWSELGRMPEVGDEVEVEADGIIFRVDDIDGREVTRVSFFLPTDTEQGDANNDY